MKHTLHRIGHAFHTSLPKALKIAWWMIRLTILVSLGVETLRYLGIIAWTSEYLSPLFQLIGLPGEASLIFLTGYFVNIYGALATIGTLSLTIRELTILGIMILCAHNMLIETAVQRKTGSPVIRMVITRTAGALIGGLLLHWLMPAENIPTAPATTPATLPLQTLASEWLLSTGWLILRMLTLIVGLSFLQRLLAEFGIIRLLSKFLRPLLKIFGLPARTSFLWIVANVLGLAYGAAVMIEETEAGKVNARDVDLLNHHIGVAHSNIEDLLLFVSFGGLFWWLLLPRWLIAMLFVWERRLELQIRHKTGTRPKPCT
ncbi:MAG: nucleoside recognition protein [Prevotellaceae bacterium]|nr:nucleoside recognition protein [Prevotellaceae bacterium]